MTKRGKKSLLKWTALLVLAALLAYFGWGIERSLHLESTPLHLLLPSVTKAAGTVRIAQVSDLHLAVYGENNQELVDLVASKRPDIIVATGDMIDKRAEGIDDTIDLFARFAALAPTVYSLGNHELDRPDLDALLRGLEGVGVQVAHNSVVTVTAAGMQLHIGGVYRAEMIETIQAQMPIDILLCHFPHQLDTLAAWGIPLTFAGHTHGGQFRFPFVDQALYAPGQGWFPQYTKGLYEKDGVYMIVSRGLGNSSFPFRVHNPPEIIIADITYINHWQSVESTT